VVGAAGGEVADVGGEEHARDVGRMGGEGADGHEGGDVAVLDQFPDVDVALRICMVSGCSVVVTRVGRGQGSQG